MDERLRENAGCMQTVTWERVSHLNATQGGDEAELHRQVVPPQSPLAALHHLVACGLVELHARWEGGEADGPGWRSVVELTVWLGKAAAARPPAALVPPKADNRSQALHLVCSLLFEEDSNRESSSADAAERAGSGLLALRERQVPVGLALGDMILPENEDTACVLWAVTGRQACGSAEDGRALWQGHPPAAHVDSSLRDDIYESVAPVDWEEEAQTPDEICCGIDTPSQLFPFWPRGMGSAGPLPLLGSPR